MKRKEESWAGGIKCQNKNKINNFSIWLVGRSKKKKISGIVCCFFFLVSFQICFSITAKEKS